MLRVDGLYAGYGDLTVIHDVSFNVEEGEMVALVGSNGAGKSTILRTISGLIAPSQGQIEFEGERITGLRPHTVAGKGIAHVPEGKHLFARMSVLDNLTLGAYLRKSEEFRAGSLAQVFDLFPVLKQRQDQRAGTLSGGEQQMLAVGRALMLQPKLLMLDEPSLGIAPKLVMDIFATIRRIREEGVTILLIEQKLEQSLRLVDRAYVLQTGRIVVQGTGDELLESDMVQKAYLGV